MPKFEVLFYQTTTGKQPAKEFLLSLDIKMRAKMSMIISILQDNGYELREPYSKHLSDGIFEIRAKVSSNVCRVLYFFYFSQTDLSRKHQKRLQKKLKKQKDTVKITYNEKGKCNECKI